MSMVGSYYSQQTFKSKPEIHNLLREKIRMAHLHKCAKAVKIILRMVYVEWGDRMHDSQRSRLEKLGADIDRLTPEQKAAVFLFILKKRLHEPLDGFNVLFLGAFKQFGDLAARDTVKNASKLVQHNHFLL